MQRRHLLLPLAAWPLVGRPAFAQAYPARPIRMLHGFAPGGNVDTIARILAPELGRRLGQSVVVEPRPGAGGAIAARAVAQATPDGYTLLLASGAHAVSAALTAAPGFNAVRDFDWISTATVFPFVIVARAQSPLTSVADVLRAAREQPGTVSFGTPGIGSTPHLIGELLANMTGTQLLHVPFKGEAAALTALLGGDIQLAIAAATAPLPFIEAGRLRAVAVTSARRWAGLPKTPTVQEAGVAGFDVGSWGGVATAAGTPSAIIERLNAEMRAVTQQPEVVKRLVEIGGEVQTSTPEQFRARVSDEVDRWSRLVRAANIPLQ